MTDIPRNYWLWVTSRETVYASGIKENNKNIWTCDGNTKKGDLIILYLNSKGESVAGYRKSSFCYLIQAKSGVYNGEHFPGWSERGWKAACDCQVIYEFKNPVRYKDLELDPEFEKWDAYKRRNFQGTSFPIPEDIWNRLDLMASERNPDYPGYRKLIASVTPLDTKMDFSANEYASVFSNHLIAPHYKQMLLANYRAPNQTLTATMMAKAMGYDNYNAANLHYGILGGLVGEKLGWNPLPEFKVNVLVDFKKDKELLWILKPVVAEAINQLGWNEDESTIPEEITENDYKPIYEGAVKKVSVNAYERSGIARAECLRHYGCKCTVCGTKLSDTYGEIALGYIHVHHLKQLAEINSKYRVDPITDLRPVCPTCHSIIHLKKPSYSIEEVQEMIKSPKT
jgi:putative restriction endonuclease